MIETLFIISGVGLLFVGLGLIEKAWDFIQGADNE